MLISCPRNMQKGTSSASASLARQIVFFTGLAFAFYLCGRCATLLNFQAVADNIPLLDLDLSGHCSWRLWVPFQPRAESHELASFSSARWTPGCEEGRLHFWPIAWIFLCLSSWCRNLWKFCIVSSLLGSWYFLLWPFKAFAWWALTLLWKLESTISAFVAPQ